MFSSLSQKFQALFSSLNSNKKLTEDNISEAVREVRIALLDADVHYRVVKNFINRVKEKSLGTEVLKSISAGNQFIKIVHDELKDLMGGTSSDLSINRHPGIIMLCGLQGSGKTTQAAKLALMLKKQNKKPLLVACDLQRPAAIDQLEMLANQIQVLVYTDRKQIKPLNVAQAAVEKAKREALDVVIIDTAGRLHLDEELMQELETLHSTIQPHETLFVANAATGQDAVNSAAQFDQRVSITGSILTMLDGTARAGAAISIREVTGKPLLFEGIGEKMTDLQVFNPHSMADRILGFGDVINLVRKAEAHLDLEEAARLKKKIRKMAFTYEDFLKQIRSIMKMGSFSSLLKMIPSFSHMKELEGSDTEISKIEAVILSMTRDEKLGLDELLPSRRRRISIGSGVSIEDVNRIVKNFKRIKKIMKNIPNFKNKILKNPKFTNFF